jgi:hypothetical protein
MLPPPPPVSKHGRQHTGRLRKRDNLLSGKGGRSQIIQRRESLVLYKSFNTLWYPSFPLIMCSCSYLRIQVQHCLYICGYITFYIFEQLSHIVRNKNIKKRENSVFRVRICYVSDKIRRSGSGMIYSGSESGIHQCLSIKLPKLYRNSIQIIPYSDQILGKLFVVLQSSL